MENIFGLVNGHIKYYTHELTYNGRIERFFDGKTDDRTEQLKRDNIDYTLTEFTLPDEETMKKHSEPTFKSLAEAQKWVAQGCPKDDIDIIKETLDALIISMLGGE